MWLLQRRCGLAAAITVLAMPAILLSGGFFAGGAAEDRFAGGWHWQAGAASLTEGVLATCVSLWAIGYFATTTTSCVRWRGAWRRRHTAPSSSTRRCSSGSR